MVAAAINKYVEGGGRLPYVVVTAEDVDFAPPANIFCVRWGMLGSGSIIIMPMDAAQAALYGSISTKQEDDDDDE